MNILILGSGGREHAFAWKIAQSPFCKQLYIAPGNPGTADCGINVPIAVTQFEELKAFCLQHSIDLVLVGPEDPLVLGIYDFFQQEALQHIHLVGPSAAGAQLEGSKGFAKEFMQKMKIPTAAYRAFSSADYEEGIAYLQQHALPVVLKADGLAAGKGVVIAASREDALAAFKEMILDRKFGNAGDKVVIEEFLTGIECSVFILTDGQNYQLLPSAKDYKRIGEGDTGLNTGGMGAISPVPFADPVFMQKVEERIIKPTLLGLQQEKIIYKGFIFIGLIKVNNEPFVIEYNCRMGDPETEVVMPRIENDLLPLLASLKMQTLHDHPCVQSTLHYATVMLVSKGYPEAYEKGTQITETAVAGRSLLFHAGTVLHDGKLLTNGGRVMAISSAGDSLAEALTVANQNAATIQFEGKYFRKDIGWEFE
ncbi:MAG: phosphoribosylamine--glycine ligase [Chitinophagaceae bacterium]|nr:phosphoribosylamine--glycine ligase [Chitinophagaceae bacterium]